MTDHETALVLLTDTEVALLGEDVAAPRGYMPVIMPCMFTTRSSPGFPMASRCSDVWMT